MTELELLRAENEKLKAVCKVYVADKENSLKEQLSTIASKLKAEYTDFQDALDMEMTIELGENMREQLKAVLKILKKAGVNL